MRRRLLFLLLLMTIPMCVKSQAHSFFGNSFLSIGAGPNFYFNTNGVGIGGGASLTGGKWLLNTAGLRLQFAAHLASSGSDPYMLYYGHCDIFFDLLTALRGRNPSDKITSYMLLGVGLVHNSLGDNDFSGIAGVGATYRIGSDWRLFAELEAFIHPSDFDNNERSSTLLTLQLGALYDIAYNPTRSRSRYETKQFSNDWFFQLALGINSFNYNGVGDFSSRMKLITPIFEFGLGKRLTSRWHIRMNLSGFYTRSADELFSYYNVRGDLMLDLMGFINPDRSHSFFDVRPYVSAGIVTRLDDQSHFLFSPAGGLQMVFAPDVRNEIYLDARYLVTPPRFAKVEMAQGSLSVGMYTLTVGYGYKFGRLSFR